MKYFFVLWIYIGASIAHAQTGIGTITPNASAKLDVFATNKGFLPPRVSLTGVNDQTTIPSPATGLLVYCNGDAGLAMGYYFWNGNSWATIATAGGSGSVAAEIGYQTLASNIAISNSTPVTIMTFTLPSAGTWEVITGVRAQGTPGFAGAFALFDSSSTIVPNTEVLCAYGENASTGTGVTHIVTTGATTYTVKGYSTFSAYTATGDSNGRTFVTWKKISGNASMTVINYGDIKTGMQSGDHNGWVKLNGRAKSTLTATQQAQATALGIGTNLPDASNAFLVQNGTTLGSVSGANTKTIAQANLPNVTLTGNSSTIADHSHTIPFVTNLNSGWGISAGSAGFNIAGTTTTSNSGSHSHTISTSSINGGVSQTQFDITPKSLSVNTFIYLGY